jgi:ATP adenylyltransferase
MEFIEGPRPSGCFFCEAAALPAERFSDRLVLARTERALALMNLYPYSNGHLMVAPYRHEGVLANLARDEAAELLTLGGRCSTALEAAFRAEGFNVGFNLGKVAGAGVQDHLHLHVVPRWAGDTNFLPVIGNTRVMPEYLGVTFEKLLPYFRAVGA